MDKDEANTNYLKISKDFVFSRVKHLCVVVTVVLDGIEIGGPRI